MGLKLKRARLPPIAVRPATGAGIVAPAVAVGCLATIAVGGVARAAGHRWGAQLAPFLASFSPHIDPLALPAALLFGACLLIAPRLVRQPDSPVAFGLAAFIIGLALRLALAAARGGPARWYAVFATDPEAAHEYLPALPALHIGLQAFLANFAAIAPSLPTHPSGHPPGMLVTLDVLGIRSARGMAALTIGVGALAVPLTHVLGRSLTTERRARIGALLFAFAPSGLLYGATSADALYATLALAAACALMAKAWTWRATGSMLVAVASFFSFALLGIAVWVVLTQALGGEKARALRTACATALAVSLSYAVLYAVTGFDVFATLHALSRDYRAGIANARPYAFWVFGSPVAYLVALGLPIGWLAVRALAMRQPAGAALASVIAISSVLGYTKAETERIWLFLVPLACLAAAALLPERRFRLTLAVLTLQAFAVELLLFTTW